MLHLENYIYGRSADKPTWRSTIGSRIAVYEKQVGYGVFVNWLRFTIGTACSLINLQQSCVLINPYVVDFQRNSRFFDFRDSPSDAYKY